MIYYTLFLQYTTKPTNSESFTCSKKPSPLETPQTYSWIHNYTLSYVNLNMPILAIDMFPSQRSFWRGALEHLDCTARIESTSSNHHFDLLSAKFLSLRPRSDPGLERGTRILTGWKVRLAALGMNPTGRCGPPTFGLSGIDNFDNVFGFVGSENP